ncbi:MAG: serine aminopeptidase domain-containing protein, partial [Octadecabacter sp.]
PMWGIRMSAALRPIAWGLSSVSKPLGFSNVFAPGQQAETYVLRAIATDNTLTSDESSFEMLQNQLKTHPELALGGPSLHWLNESLREMRHLANLASPKIPCVTFLGTDEVIVDPARVYDRMDRWPNGDLVVLDKGRHEVLMERPELRNQVLNGATALFAAHTPELA